VIELVHPRTAKNDTAYTGYRSTLMDDDCMNPIMYVKMRNNSVYAAHTRVLMHLLLDWRRKDPRAAMNHKRAISTTIKASILTTRPLGS
jgi:hypothetical protein